MDQVRPELADLFADLGLPAWALEDKGSSLAVHTRRLPQPEQAWAAVRAPLAELAARHGLGLLEGRLVWELRVPGTDKGTALSALVAERRRACRDGRATTSWTSRRSTSWSDCGPAARPPGSPCAAPPRGPDDRRARPSVGRGASGPTSSCPARPGVVALLDRLVAARRGRRVPLPRPRS